MPNEGTAAMTEHNKGRLQRSGQAKTFSNRLCPKTSTANPSRAWLSSWISPRRPDPTRSGAECPMALS
jgi:hypothetical protein